MQFEGADDHNHYHLKNAAEYTLRTLDGTGQVALAQKTQAGFCLEDSQAIAGEDLQGPYSANRGDRRQQLLLAERTRTDRAPSWSWASRPAGATSTAPGSPTSGWTPRPSQPGQVQDRGPRRSRQRHRREQRGQQRLRSCATSRCRATSRSRRAVPMRRVGARRARRDEVHRERLRRGNGPAGQPGTRRFMIVAGPKHGTLNVGRGPGADRLAGRRLHAEGRLPGDRTASLYVALLRGDCRQRQTRTYPNNPAPATVTLVGATPAVGLSGAPPSMIARDERPAHAPAVVERPLRRHLERERRHDHADRPLHGAGAAGSVTVTARRAPTTPSVGARPSIAITRGRRSRARDRARSWRRATSSLSAAQDHAQAASGRSSPRSSPARRAARSAFTADLRQEGPRPMRPSGPGRASAVTCRMKLTKDYTLKKVRITAKYTRGKSARCAAPSSSAERERTPRAPDREPSGSVRARPVRGRDGVGSGGLSGRDGRRHGAAQRIGSARRARLRRVGGRGPGPGGAARRAGELPVHARHPPHDVPREGRGRCASTRASPRRRRPTPASATCSPPGRRASRPPSTCRPSSGSTPTTRWPPARSAGSGVAIDSLEDMARLFDGIPLDSVSTSMTINAPAAVLLLLYALVGRGAGRRPARAARHDPERRAQGVRRARQLHLPARGARCGSPPTRSPTATPRCRAGTRSRSAATTSARRARRRCRRWPSRWPTASPTSRRRWRRAWTSTASAGACRSSSTRTTTSWRRSPSSGRPARSGPRSCASASARPSRAP